MPDEATRIHQQPGAPSRPRSHCWAVADRFCAASNNGIETRRLRSANTEDGEIFSRALHERREFYLLGIAFVTVALAIGAGNGGSDGVCRNAAAAAWRYRGGGSGDRVPVRPLELPSYFAQEA